MNNEILELPGYYYDREKNKYFKIQASGTTPSSSSYSSADVKRRMIEDESSKAVALGLLQHQRRIKRSRILEDPLAGGFLAREHGQSRLDVAASIYAGGLVRQGRLRVSRSDLATIFAIEHRQDLGPSLVDLRVAYLDGLFTYRLNCDKYYKSTATDIVNICQSDEDLWSDVWMRFDEFDSDGASTSLSTNYKHRNLAMTWLANSSHSGIAITPMKGLWSDNEPERANIIIGPGTTRGRNVSIYSSAPAPPRSQYLFAFGSSHGILLADTQNYDAQWLGPIPQPSRNYPQEVFAIEFLSNDLLLSGGRRGILDITDLRIPKFGTDADVIHHPSSITHIKTINDHRIVVAGLRSSLCQYDMRFRKTSFTCVASKSKYPIKRELTEPILQCADYSNSAAIQIGFDVDLEAGVIAAAQDFDQSINLFSLHGGHVVQRLCNHKHKSTNWLKFARDSPNMTKSLYFSSGGDIERWAWADEEDADVGGPTSFGGGSSSARKYAMQARNLP